MEVTIKTVRAVSLPELDDEFAKTVGAGETLAALRETVKKDVENRSKAEYDDKYFVDLIEKIKESAILKYHPQALEHEGEHVLQDLGQRLSQQGMDLDTYFKVRNTTREQFVEDEVKPVAQKRFERSLILDELVRREKIEVDNEALDAEFNQTLSSLTMQGVDLSKIRGGRQGQQRVAQSIAMESANRILTRRALDTLKAIATGEYIPPEERQKAAEEGETAPVEEPVEGEENAQEAEPAAGENEAEPKSE
jgi:FKBP-type peptidyl-prolyl cis-trans isomerase (trigger factor)